MLRWSFGFLVLALIAGLLGFTGIAGESFYIARVLLFIFMIIFLVSLMLSLFTANRRPG